MIRRNKFKKKCPNLKIFTPSVPRDSKIIRKTWAKVSKNGTPDMINGFLNISRLESGKIHLVQSEFDFSELIEEVCIDYKLQYSTHHINHSNAQSAIITADRLKIAQVVNNLVGNAVKYSEIGTRINISYAVNDQYLTVNINNEGMGVKPENLKKLFDRYYRVEQESKISGFGIGLYLSAEIIEAHRGRIWAESIFGLGSSFYFELPLA